LILWFAESNWKFSGVNRSPLKAAAHIESSKGGTLALFSSNVALTVCQ